MASRALVLAFDGEAVLLGEMLNQQVELLREAHRVSDPVAAEVLRGTGTVRSAEELPGPELPLQTARLVVARDHGYADWAEVREHAGTLVDTRFEAAADAIQWASWRRSATCSTRTRR